MHHISLCFGDWLYWRRRGVSYRGRFEDWPGYLEAFMTRNGVTDILYYSDRHPYHRIAGDIGRNAGIRVTTYEYGYLRPDWITLERGGMSAFSHFPDDPAIIRAIAAKVEPPDMRFLYPFPFWQQAANEVIYNLGTSLLFFLYPHYKSNRYYHPIVDYLSHFWRVLQAPYKERKAKRLIAKAARLKVPYFVFAMQLQSDYQIRENSPFEHLREAVEVTIASFAAHAPADHLLIFKIHPLDNGLERWPRVIFAIAAEHDIADRIRVIDGGNLQALLTNARGAVLVNSTVGLHSVQAGCPVKVLGSAVFDVSGLTFQGPLDDFWTEARPPDADFITAFVKALAAATQVKGNFHTRDGRKAAVDEMATRLIEDKINAPDAYIDPPPRLAEFQRKKQDTL